MKASENGRGASRSRRKGGSPRVQAAGGRPAPVSTPQPDALSGLEDHEPIDLGDDGYLAKLIVVILVVGGIVLAAYIAVTPRPELCPLPARVVRR